MFAIIYEYNWIFTCFYFNIHVKESYIFLFWILLSVGVYKLYIFYINLTTLLLTSATNLVNLLLIELSSGTTHSNTQ